MADDTPTNADFIGRVVGDAKNPPETRLLTGWLGDAADEGYRRLYTEADLSAYVDIPADAILHTEPIRDVQPAGGVLVWIQRDAAVKPGGSAASRAARFLQGQVQQDFASGGGAAAGGAQGPGSLEKAGFRCVTQVPCSEPTGFTGQCTQQPEVGGAWPCITAIPHCFEPTGFTGKCTHQPWPNPSQYIGCTFLHCPTQDLTHVPHICNIVATGMPGCTVVDPQGGGIDPAAKVDAAAGEKVAGGSPAVQPTPPLTVFPGCGHTKTWGVCETHLLGCGFTKQWGQQCPTQLPGCGQTKDCPTTLPGCGWSKNPICTDLPGCGFTKQWGVCQQTQPPKCNVSVDIPCITQDNACGVTRNPACFANVGGGEFAAFRAAAPGPGIPINTPFPCNVSVAGTCPSAVDACPTQKGCQTQPPTAMASCTQIGPHCPTKATICTQTGPQCPTSCGPDCQSQQLNCTQMGEICLTHPVECTQFGPKCPSVGIACTIPPACPTHVVNCTVTPPICNLNMAAARAQAFGQVGPIGPTAFVGCTQAGPQCPTYPSGDCTFFGCPTGGQAGAAGPGMGCTQSGPQCPTHAQPHCTCAGPGCPPTPATVCTQGGPQCPTYPNGDCTFFGCPPPPTPVCARFAPGGGPSAVDACPTRICNTQQVCPSAWGACFPGPTYYYCTNIYHACPRPTLTPACWPPD